MKHINSELYPQREQGERMIQGFSKALILACVLNITTVSETGAQALTLLKLVGGVTLSDGESPAGTKVTLSADLNRNGKYEKFEKASAEVNADGSYSLDLSLSISDVNFDMISYVTEIISDFQSGGFETLITDSPLNVILVIEREGYSKVVKSLSTNLMQLYLSAQLIPLMKMYCDDDRCGALDGSVIIEGFSGGKDIASGYTKAYDPTLDADRFPGSFTDADDNILVSSGFVEVNLRDDSGSTISSLSEPASVHFELNPESWNALVDRNPDSGRIEVSMYSFNEKDAKWIREPDGVLVTENGSTVDEEELNAIQEGTYSERIFVKFTTSHFSYFNVDEPVGSHACVKGRLVTSDGNAMGGMSVTAEGVSYTGSTPGMTTATDGYFAVGVMKSETNSEDIDWNTVVGETFTARLVVAGSAGVSTEFTFDTPTTSKKIVDKGGINCVPQLCPCEDLGDVEITIVPPRLCEVTLHATFKGKSDTDDYVVGESIIDMEVHSSLVNVSAPMPSLAIDLCKDHSCNGGTTDINGKASIVVPIYGNPDKIKLEANWRKKRADQKWDVYYGIVDVDACDQGMVAVSGEVELEINHTVKQDMGSFIEQMFPSISDSDKGGIFGDLGKSGCQCTIGHEGQNRRRAVLPILLAIGIGFCFLGRPRKKRISGKR